MNKYFTRIRRFDISNAVRKKDEKVLLCEEYVKNICNNHLEVVDEMLKSDDGPDDYKIERLNSLLKDINDALIYTTQVTIEYAIELDIFIRAMRKIFMLKARRSDLPIDEILEKYK